MNDIREQLEMFDFRGKPRSQFQTHNTEPPRTITSDAAGADINEILKQYDGVGVLASLNKAELQFLDVSEFTDYADAMRHTRLAEVEFMKLPSKVREIFDHDVAVWLDTAHDDDKREAMMEAGLIERPKEKKVAAVAAEAPPEEPKSGEV